MSHSAVLNIAPLGFPWQTEDPFLFCVNHDDAYPAGNEQMGPAASLGGRHIGQDFAGKDGWNMYHGDVVPGFPQHPHRGFETVTIVRQGLIDHSDSLGATARFGRGDVQWLTAGNGIVHCEMFPLVNRQTPNPLALFQIWLNLPHADKLVAPHFSMLWAESIPRHKAIDANGLQTTVTVVAGQFGGMKAPPPPPHSWASRQDTDVAIWMLTLQAGARVSLPPAVPGTNRTLYFFSGQGLSVDGAIVPPSSRVCLRPDAAVSLAGGRDETTLLLLQGRPIGEPVAQRGPFVMTTNAEITKAIVDYQTTSFGGWPWPSDGPVHPRDEGRFAKHADGRVERIG